MMVDPLHLVDCVDRAIDGNQHAVKAWKAVRKAVMMDREASLDEAQSFYDAYQDAEVLPKRKIGPLEDDMIVNLEGID